MAKLGSGSVAWRLARELASARNEVQAASAIARAAVVVSGAALARLWVIDHRAGYRLAGAWPEETGPPRSAPGAVARAVVLGSTEAGAAEAPHRPSLVVPLLAGLKPLGAIELLESSRDLGAFGPPDGALLGDLLETAPIVLASARERAKRETDHIEVVARLTRLFDIGRSFSRTLDQDELLPVVANRTHAAMEVEAAYLWEIDPDANEVVLRAAAGPLAVDAEGQRLPLGEGIVGAVAQSGEAKIVSDEDEISEIAELPEIASGSRIRSIAAAPVTAEGDTVLGVLEVVNPAGEGTFERADLGFLNELAETAAVALGNARRLDAERRASDLGALLSLSRMLGATLDVQKVAFTLVHQASSVLHYKRAAVGLLRGTRVSLAAVSGSTFVDESLAEMEALRALLDWAAGLDEGLYVVQEPDGSIDTPRPETREKFREYFERTGTESFLAVPLLDEEGKVGVLSFESSTAYAFGERDLEAATLLAVQGTMAVRNALLYQQIPMARLFEPLARRKEKLLRHPLSRRVAIGTGVLLVAALLFLPVPLRIAGDARVLPERRLPVIADVGGRVAAVAVREGDLVAPGQLIARLDDGDVRAERETAQAAYDVCLREMARLRASGDGAQAAIEAARVPGLSAELALWDERLLKTVIRSESAGVVATPRIEERTGERLARGDLFCELVEPERRKLEIAIPETDAALVAAGMPVKLKLYAHPTRSFRARVERVGVEAGTASGDDASTDRVLLVRANLEGAGTFVPGMTGRAKIDTGRAPVVRVLLRRPARWIWNAIWGWLP